MTTQVGEIPHGAPLRCRLNRHKPKPGAGLAVYECDRCGGTFWQPEEVRAQIKYAEAAIARGDLAEADRIRHAALKSVGQNPYPPPKED